MHILAFCLFFSSWYRCAFLKARGIMASANSPIGIVVAVTKFLSGLRSNCDTHLVLCDVNMNPNVIATHSNRLFDDMPFGLSRNLVGSIDRSTRIKGLDKLYEFVRNVRFLHNPGYLKLGRGFPFFEEEI